jgi:oxygen-independent coproporphyrinogen III oxidase
VLRRHPLPRRPPRTDLAQQRPAYDAIGMDHYALSGDSLAVAARQGCLHRNFQGYTTGGELELLGVGPTAISQFPGLFSQNQRDLKAYRASLAAGQLPVERGLLVTDPEVLERRELIREVMCHFRVAIDPGRYSREWADQTLLAADGLVRLSQADGQGLVEVTASGRWLIRTVAAVFDPSQCRAASGSRLI